MFDDIDLSEINPIHVALALVAAIISIIVMSQVEIGILYKAGAFIGTFIVSYIVIGRIFGS